MKKIKIFLFSLLLFYVSNILIWFLYNRNKIIRGLDKLSNSDTFNREAFINNGLSYDKMYNSMVDNVDTNIFNPAFNIGYGLGSKHQLIPILIIFAIYVFYLIKKSSSKKKS